MCIMEICVYIIILFGDKDFLRLNRITNVEVQSYEKGHRQRKDTVVYYIIFIERCQPRGGCQNYLSSVGRDRRKAIGYNVNIL